MDVHLHEIEAELLVDVELPLDGGKVGALPEPASVVVGRLEQIDRVPFDGPRACGKLAQDGVEVVQIALLHGKVVGPVARDGRLGSVRHESSGESWRGREARAQEEYSSNTELKHKSPVLRGF